MTWKSCRQQKHPECLTVGNIPVMFPPPPCTYCFSAWLNSVLLERSNCSQTPCESIVFAHRLPQDNGADDGPYSSVGSEYNVVDFFFFFFFFCQSHDPDSQCVVQLDGLKRSFFFFFRLFFWGDWGAIFHVSILLATPGKPLNIL